METHACLNGTALDVGTSENVTSSSTVLDVDSESVTSSSTVLDVESENATVADGYESSSSGLSGITSNNYHQRRRWQKGTSKQNGKVMPSENSGGGGVFCVRVSLIVFNAIALLAGLATVGIGLWLIFQKPVTEADIVVAAGTTDQYLLAAGDMKVISILLLSVGSLVTFVSVIGCTGACVKSRCLLMSYLLTVVLVLTLQLIAAVCVFLYREPIAVGLHDELMADLKNEAELNPENAVKRSWDIMQHHIQCCGVDTYRDWYKFKAWPEKNYVPDSCCIYVNDSVAPGCGRTDNPSLWYDQGCLEKIKSAILEQLHVMASIVITLVFLQLYGIIASVLVFFHSKTPKPKSPQYKAYLYERARM